MIDKVEKIPFSSNGEFEERFLSPGIPVVLTGLHGEWSTPAKWTPDLLAKQFGNHKVPVATIHNGDYINGVQTEMLFGEYLQKIGALDDNKEAKSNSDSTIAYYLAQVPVDKYFPELASEIELPSFFTNETPGSTVFYIGNSLFSQLHYHPFGSATQTLLYGEKRVRLFPPDQSHCLYPHPWHAKYPNLSKTHNKIPDPELYPKFSEAKFIDVTVSAGETLFFPIYWWHSIENIGVSVAVTSFWTRSWTARFIPPSSARAAYFAEPVKKVSNAGKKAAGKALRLSGLR